jgi:glycosyltransferase involved in cell wall biosynthesis
MIEAMACGTPVIAFSCGSVPEIIENGLTGFVVEPEQAMTAIRQATKLDRHAVRARFEQRFTARQMAEKYVEVYNAIGAEAGDATYAFDHSVARVDLALNVSRPSI